MRFEYKWKIKLFYCVIFAFDISFCKRYERMFNVLILKKCIQTANLML